MRNVRKTLPGEAIARVRKISENVAFSIIPEKDEIINKRECYKIQALYPMLVCSRNSR
jgi:hypothetical protein